MADGRNRNTRATIYSQAKLFGSCDDIDGPTWVNDGEVFVKGQPIEMSPELAEAVAKHRKKCEEAGRFVMPD